MYCADHPKVETGLRCGKCGKPICPRCVVQTPVGARCRSCANVRSLPTYRLSLPYHLRAWGAGLVLAAPAGFLWAILEQLLPFGLLTFILAAALGYGLAELVSLSANRKRGRSLQVVAAVSFALAFVTRTLFLDLPFYDLYGLLALGLGLFLAIGQLR